MFTLVDAGGASNDPKVRNKAYHAALRLVAERAHFIPLFTYVKSYATSKDMNFRPDSHDRALLPGKLEVAPADCAHGA